VELKIKTILMDEFVEYFGELLKSGNKIIGKVIVTM
jgi:hypothetical protein